MKNVNKALQDLKELKAIQWENINDSYMQGMYNGMELAIATLEDRHPYYIDKDRNYEVDINEYPELIINGTIFVKEKENGNS